MRAVNRQPCLPREGLVEPSLPRSPVWCDATLSPTKFHFWMLWNSRCCQLCSPKMSSFSKLPNRFFDLDVSLNALLDAREHSKSGLEASWKLPACFPEKSKFHENRHFSVLCQDLSSIRTFAQGIDLEQPRHFWTALLLIFKEKLLRCRLNLQILSYEHFSDQNTQIFPSPVDARFPVILNYS